MLLATSREVRAAMEDPFTYGVTVQHVLRQVVLRTSLEGCRTAIRLLMRLGLGGLLWLPPLCA